MTISELWKLCDEQIAAGNGDLKVILSNDEEGNGYHELFYPFITNQEIINDAIEWTGSEHHITENKAGYAILG